ncbi:MAG: glycosyltransferase [Candidatus Binatia bacterium]|nr:glycosyltransferase [Candidatus Binatia bacterium]
MGSSGNRPPRATVIVATYENPAALSLVFAGLARQTTPDFEIVVADDGSGDTTRDLVSTFARGSRLLVHHTWHADEGLQKGRIVNRALLDARSDYVIFLDGDCIPGPTFVQAHLAIARPGAYLSGGCVLLSSDASHTLRPDLIENGALDGLRACRPGNRRSRRLAVFGIPPLSALLDRRFARHPVGFHGGNASTWRADLVEIGGFDERLRRFEDKDIGHRLRLRGFRGESVRYRIPTWHVHHERPYVDQAMRDESRALFEANVASGERRTHHGLAPAVDAGTRAP